jgi:phage/conjugal plasmid C-4 type zinc finger TraR family protein
MRPEDRAQELELAEYERNQANAIMPPVKRPSARWCSCGEHIPDARQQAVPGVQLCLKCQGFNELVGARRAVPVRGSR